MKTIMINTRFAEFIRCLHQGHLYNQDRNYIQLLKLYDNFMLFLFNYDFKLQLSKNSKVTLTQCFLSILQAHILLLFLNKLQFD